MAALIAFLMVSNVRYRSHKTVKLVSIKPFRLLAILVVIVGMAAYNPALAGFFFFFSFALSGLLEWILGWKKATDDDEIFQPIDQDSSIMEPGSMEPLYKDDEHKGKR